MDNIAEQLTRIYLDKEPWHKTKMGYETALQYHKKRLLNGDIYVDEQDNKVRGYYERYFIGDTCFLNNVFVDEQYRGNGVFSNLKKHFFKTMPKNVTRIVGEKQKLKGKVMEAKYGYY